MLEGEEYCEKVDLWAVGVVTYVVLSGTMPFAEAPERGGRAKMYQDIMRGYYSFSSKVRSHQVMGHQLVAITGLHLMGMKVPLSCRTKFTYVVLISYFTSLLTNIITNYAHFIALDNVIS